MACQPSQWYCTHQETNLGKFNRATQHTPHTCECHHTAAIIFIFLSCCSPRSVAHIHFHPDIHSPWCVYACVQQEAAVRRCITCSYVVVLVVLLLLVVVVAAAVARCVQCPAHTAYNNREPAHDICSTLSIPPPPFTHRVSTSRPVAVTKRCTAPPPRATTPTWHCLSRYGDDDGCSHIHPHHNTPKQNTP